MPPTIRLRGAREHNLQGLDLEIPGGAVTVLAGVSGSGKSSLAFDTVAREGMRRFLATLAATESGSAAARRLASIPRPEVASIDGLPAVLAVGQGDPVLGPRTTLGSLAGVAPALRVLLARFGTLHCPRCGRPRPQTSTPEVVARILRDHDGHALRLLSPLAAAPGERPPLEDLPRRGVVRAWRATPGGGEEIRLDEGSVDARGEGPWLAVVDRLVVRPGEASRLAEAAERALDLGAGRLVVEFEGNLEHHATSRGCPDCGVPLPEPSPRLLSRSSGPGACGACAGALPEEACATCSACGGSGLSEQARALRLDGRSLADVEGEEIVAVLRWIGQVALPAGAAATELREEIRERLATLVSLGLGAHRLRRAARSLSTGETQRARCAAALGARVAGALYVLDEPTVGCHALDRARLIERLRVVRDRGNTLLVVEHDLEVIASADRVIELGPGGGASGGRIVARGTPAEVAATEGSPTGRLLAGRGEAPRRRDRDLSSATPWVRIAGARGHNLRSVSTRFPAGAVTAVTGVSGSGKSSLVFGTLAAAARRALRGDALSAEPMLPHDAIEGLDAFDRRVVVGPRLPGRSARSTPLTILGIGAELRELLAATPAARVRGWNASHFTANRSGWRSRDGETAGEGGRCETCAGLGFRLLDLDLLEPITVPCDACGGTRFAPSTLTVSWRGRHVAEWLDLSLEEAARELEAIPRIARALRPAVALGLGYLRLGERSDTLSGGELKRLQIAREAAATESAGRALVLLDEPTRGLHGRDVARLVDVLHELADRGHAVVVVEHALDVVRAADWVVDLGPGAGDEGGRVVGEGSPEAIAALDTPTGRALRAPRRAEARSTARPEPPRAEIRVRGARTRNLQALDADLRRGELTVVSGPAGSGKSTLVVDVIGAEGSRRFLAALAVSERRALERLDPPEADAIEGVGATVVLREAPAAKPWGEAAGLLPLLRSLFARFAVPHCADCGVALVRRAPDAVADEALAKHGGRRARVVAPLATEDWTALAASLLARGFVRVLLDGREQRIEDVPSVVGAPLELVVDRLEIRDADRPRLREALREAANAGDGRGALVFAEAGGESGAVSRLDFDVRGGCARCGLRLSRPLAPADFGAAPLPAEAAHARFGDHHWPKTGWSLALLRDFLAGSRLGVPAGAEVLVSALAERARLVAGIVPGGLSLDAPDAAAEGRAAWIAAAAGTSPGGCVVAVDDPTRGLGPGPAGRVLEVLRAVADGDRTVVVASADPLAADAADRVIELGPGAGAAGGRVLQQGPPRARAARAVVPRARRSAAGPSPLLTIPIDGAPEPIRARSLQIVGVAPHRAPIAALHDALRAFGDVVTAGLDACSVAPCTPVEALGLLEPLAALWARAPEAREAGFGPERFRWDAGPRGSGRCEICAGRGTVELDAALLPGAAAPCVACDGARFEPRTLAIRVFGRTIAETLALSIDGAAAALAEVPRIAQRLETARSLGLGHLPLARPAEQATPSESSRLRLAEALGRASEGAALILGHVVDGLHGADRERVLDALRARARAGGLVVLFDPREPRRSTRKPRSAPRARAREEKRVG